MARINIEDTLWADSKFMRLCALVGDEVKAAGFVVLAYRKAFKYWCPEKAPIPLDEWAISGLTDHLISVGLAERRDDGIYMKGSESQFQWWFDASAKGKKSAAARVKKNGTAQPKKRSKTSNTCSTRDEQLTNRPEPLPLPPSLPPSLPLSQTHAQTQNLNLSGGVADAHPPSTRSIADAVWQEYQNAYRTRHGTEPVRNGMVNGQISNLIKRLGQEAPQVAKFFLTHNDAFYVRAKHPVGLLLRDAEKLRTEWVTGRQVTGQTARAAEKESTMNDQLLRISRGEL